MRLSAARAPLLALALLAACGEIAPGAGSVVRGAAPVLPASPPGDPCNAAAHAGLVGQPATALERVLILRPIRLIRPGTAVTEDFSPGRLNIRIDGSERILSVTCG